MFYEITNFFSWNQFHLLWKVGTSRDVILKLESKLPSFVTSVSTNIFFCWFYICHIIFMRRAPIKQSKFYNNESNIWWYEKSFYLTFCVKIKQDLWLTFLYICLLYLHQNHHSNETKRFSAFFHTLLHKIQLNFS